MQIEKTGKIELLKTTKITAKIIIIPEMEISIFTCKTLSLSVRYIS